MAFQRTCGGCGRVYSGYRFELAEKHVCDDCGRPLGDLLDEADAAWPGPDPATAAEPVAESAQWTLRGVVDGHIIDLPRPFGLIGRVQANCRDYFAGVTTVSRQQFSYRYTGEGLIELVDMSSFGTTVNRRRLAKSETARLTPGSVVAFGGLEFVLAVKEG
jgi:hypothetical protein